jgi:hypothetical protein
MKHITLLAAALLLVNGCSDETKKELKQEVSFKTVEYYKSHKDFMELRVKECKLMKSMTPIIEKDCQNAVEAKRQSRQNSINFRY